MHPSTFEYLMPTDAQKKTIETARAAAKAYWDIIEPFLHDGDGKRLVVDKLREAAMWVNVDITRFPDGTPRP